MDSFGKGFGILLGIGAAILCIVLALEFGGKIISQHVKSCSSCGGSGNCGMCAGSGKGMLFGDCIKCDGKKRCSSCGGVGYTGR